MTRYEYIAKGGIDEMAKAIAFQLVTFYETDHKINFSCEELKANIETATKELKPWLEQEIKEG